jgi:hypothetical protein
VGSNPTPRTNLLVKYIKETALRGFMVNKKELKQRAIYVYPPTEIAQRWKNMAEESGASISKFVLEHVENSIGAEEDQGFKPRIDLIEENRRLLEDIVEKERRIHHLELLVGKLEEDLRVYRAKQFQDPDETRVRGYERKLVQLLREPGYHPDVEILAKLGVDTGNSEHVKGVSAQLESLQQMSLVRETGKGWIWVEQQ